ncbi:hypothetical protein SGFS_038880 [Streptomyces graminofaciens]|uniref:Uncharacterized protein n=1 Tax=Streptomyces graminofaciens TaxID=68212 RepID=A0ABM7F7U3_9ACTN|nr:hypothetical protein SGFS_038880 [Streptomyces graminofaciens]
MPGFVAGRSSFSQAATADEGDGFCAGGGPGACTGAGGMPGIPGAPAPTPGVPAGMGGRAGAGGTSGGPVGRGTGFACVPRASRVPSLSIALAP